MRIREPDYYKAFRCLAGACPHTCCAGWEVVVDPETAARYQALPGALGAELRAALIRDEDGDWCFQNRDGRCPFLDGEGLCRIHRRLGPEATSLTCREHPRFIEDYGPFREVTLSASCPAACALLLGSRDPLTFPTRETEEPEEPGDPWLEGLVPLRERMLAMLVRRSRPMEVRLRALLDWAAAAQELLDRDLPEALADLPEPEEPRARLPRAEDLLALLETLEVLEPDWPEVLRAAASASPAEVPEPLQERVCVYFAFRYLLKAVNDGDLLSRARLCAAAVTVFSRLAAVCGAEEGLRRLSCEVEHSQPNLEALLDWCRGGMGLDCAFR